MLPGVLQGCFNKRAAKCDLLFLDFSVLISLLGWVELEQQSSPLGSRNLPLHL